MSPRRFGLVKLWRWNFRSSLETGFIQVWLPVAEELPCCQVLRSVPWINISNFFKGHMFSRRLRPDEPPETSAVSFGLREPVCPFSSFGEKDSPSPPPDVTSISAAIFSEFWNLWIENKSRLVLKYYKSKTYSSGHGCQSAVGSQFSKRPNIHVHWSIIAVSEVRAVLRQTVQTGGLNKREY